MPSSSTGWLRITVLVGRNRKSTPLRRAGPSSCSARRCRIGSTRTGCGSSQCDVLIERPGGEARLENGQFAPDRANLTIINACADTGCQRLPCRLTQAAEEEVK